MSRVRLTAHAFVVLFCAVAASAASAADRKTKTSSPLAPFSPGMTLEQAQAAAPQLNWRAMRTSTLTGRPLSISADNALQIGGVPHSIELVRGYHGAGSARLVHSVTAENSARCEQITVGILADLESRYGVFRASPPTVADGTTTLPGWRTQRTENGVIVVPDPAMPGMTVPRRRPLPHAVVKAGKRSRLIFDVAQEGRPRTGHSEYESRGLSVNLASRYAPGSSHGRECIVETTVIQRGEHVPRRTVEIPAEMLEHGVPIGVRHHSLDRIYIPVSGTVRIECIPSTTSGRLVCGPIIGQDVDLDVSGVAIRRMESLKLDPSSIDLDDPSIQRIEATVVVSAADRVPLDFVTAPRTPSNQIQWRRVPSKEDLQSFRLPGGGRVQVVCQIQRDASLVCAAVGDNASAIPPASATDAQRSAVEIMRRYVPEPVLKSGAPAAGAVFATSVDFGA